MNSVVLPVSHEKTPVGREERASSPQSLPNLLIRRGIVVLFARTHHQRVGKKGGGDCAGRSVSFLLVLPGKYGAAISLKEQVSHVQDIQLFHFWRRHSLASVC